MADYTSRVLNAQSKYEADAMIAVHTANQCGSPHQENAAGVGDHPDIDQETVDDRSREDLQTGQISSLLFSKRITTIPRPKEHLTE